ncbi:MAG: DUF4291 domain-containing protein [Myxococcota bacterium]
MSVAKYEIRADFDRDTIVVYQAYGDTIANGAIAAGTFVSPFSRRRMTWIKPSFLWLMQRSGWGTKTNQERILAVRITRAGWESALGRAVLTNWDKAVHATHDAWAVDFERAHAHVQWDPERSLRGAKLEHRSIQVGISRHLIDAFVDAWIVGVEDYTARAHKIRRLLRDGKADAARRLLPPEEIYPLDAKLGARIGASASILAPYRTRATATSPGTGAWDKALRRSRR